MEQFAAQRSISDVIRARVFSFVICFAFDLLPAVKLSLSSASVAQFLPHQTK